MITWMGGFDPVPRPETPLLAVDVIIELTALYRPEVLSSAVCALSVSRKA